MTSLPPSQLNAAPWLAAHRAAWNIESSLHQCLDSLHRHNAYRVRRSKVTRPIAMFRRFSSSRFLELAIRAEEASTQDDHGFFGVMKAEHCRYAFRCLQARQPSLQTPS